MAGTWSEKTFGVVTKEVSVCAFPYLILDIKSWIDGSGSAILHPQPTSDILDMHPIMTKKAFHLFQSQIK